MTISSPTNSGWTANGCRWRSSKTVLPGSPVFSGGVLLTRQRVLKDIPRVTPDGFGSWAEQNENETLRFDLNYSDTTTVVEPDSRGAIGCGIAPAAVKLASSS
jgi:hypothetical protein